jgi:hypothetical protein
MSVNCLADIRSFQPDDRLLHVAPLSHGSGMYLIPALSRGAENIIEAGGGFDPDRVLHFVANERVTVLPFLAPTMIVRLLEADPGIRVPTMRAIVYGGAPIHLRRLRAALQRFGPVLTQLYGQGESPMTISALPAWAHKNRDDEALQSAGFVRSGVEVRILDADGAVAPHEEIGEIAVRGDVVMRGYWRNNDANAACLSDGWLKTGDIGRFDARGHLHILDRRHDADHQRGLQYLPARGRGHSHAPPSGQRSDRLRPPRPGMGRKRRVCNRVARRICRRRCGYTDRVLPGASWELQEAKADRICHRASEERLRKSSAPGFARSVQYSTLKRQLFARAGQRVDGDSPVGCKGMWSFETCRRLARLMENRPTYRGEALKVAFQAEDEEIALPDVMRDLSHQRQIYVEHRNSESESIVLSWVRQHASRNLWALGLSSLRRASDGSLLVVFCLTCANGPQPPLLVGVGRFSFSW